ncbi:MAG: carboxypeptidase-like regulatory domain-containing protein [Alistipes sp.]|jgi:hypothetical protein|nr:carboxypeptidase-like regulatory domain-containing protein [Alistipes sp.]
MKIKHLLISAAALLSSAISISTALAQEPFATGGVNGEVVTRTGRLPIEGVKVILMPGAVETRTAEGGRFSFEGLPEGQYTVTFEGDELETAEVNVRVAKTVRDITVPMISAATFENMDDLDIVDFDMEGSDDAQYSGSSTLSSSKDLFSNIAGYKFSEMRFNARGMRNENVFLNGVEFNDALTGYSPWSLWTGLNDATRNQEAQAGVGAVAYGLGGVNGNTNINARASQMRQGFRGSLAGGTNSYLMRVMATYASGMLDNGWSYGFSASTRQGRHAYVDGVYYDTWGWFASVEKRFGKGHNLSLTAFGTPTERGAQAASTDEVYTLTMNSFYNPNWGMYDGKMRNARVRNNHEPVAMLGYTWNDPNGKLILNATAAYRFGRNGYSALDWFNGKDPRPDYYRRLPSWFTTEWLYNPETGDNDRPGRFGREEGDQFVKAFDMWVDNDPRYTQIDWDDIVNRNRDNRLDVERGERVEGDVDPDNMARSAYVIEERRTDQDDAQFAVRLEHNVSSKSKLTYGVNYRHNRTEYFKTVKDLLGGDYFIDINNFAVRDELFDSDAIQNDIARPNRALFEGDKYGYDYYAHLRKGGAWLMYNHTLSTVDFYAGAEAGYTSFWREGLVEAGLFPNAAAESVDYTSLGDSEHQNFLTYKAKAGVSLNLGGAHNFALNAAYDNRAPYFQSAFTSPRTRNEVTPGLTTEKTLAVDLTWNMRYPWARVRVAGYFLQMNDGAKIQSFYDDTGEVRSFTNFAMSGIGQRHMGVEFAAEIPIAWGISLNTAVNYGNYVYTGNPRVTQTVDNSAYKHLDNAEVYYNGLRVEGTPQFAANVGLSLRSGNGWFAGIDLNMYDHLYLSMNPLFRTDSAFENMDKFSYGQYLMDEMVAQDRLPFAVTLNANVSKNWYLETGRLGVSLEAKNLLNNHGIRTGGYEQSRMWRLSDKEAIDPFLKFDSKYFYLYGVNFYLNVYYSF